MSHTATDCSFFEDFYENAWQYLVTMNPDLTINTACLVTKQVWECYLGCTQGCEQHFSTKHREVPPTGRAPTQAWGEASGLPSLQKVSSVISSSSSEGERAWDNPRQVMHSVQAFNLSTRDTGFTNEEDCFAVRWMKHKRPFCDSGATFSINAVRLSQSFMLSRKCLLNLSQRQLFLPSEILKYLIYTYKYPPF